MYAAHNVPGFLSLSPMLLPDGTFITQQNATLLERGK